MKVVALSGIALFASLAIAASPEATTAKKAPEAPKAPSMGAALDIVDTAASTGAHNTLVAAVKAAGLVETLKGKGPFTVFAPTDDAFKKLPAGTLDTLLKPESKKALTDILTFHVHAGNLMAADVVKLKEIKTVQGQSFLVEVKDGKVHIGNDPKAMATVTKADVKTSNGVIHVIDTVILPAAPAPEKK